jgi:hypothetical protein
VSEINMLSEVSHFVRPLTALEKLPRSERKLADHLSSSGCAHLHGVISRCSVSLIMWTGGAWRTSKFTVVPHNNISCGKEVATKIKTPGDGLDGVDFEALHINLSRP